MTRRLLVGFSGGYRPKLVRSQNEWAKTSMAYLVHPRIWWPKWLIKASERVSKTEKDLQQTLSNVSAQAINRRATSTTSKASRQPPIRAIPAIILLILIGPLFYFKNPFAQNLVRLFTFAKFLISLLTRYILIYFGIIFHITYILHLSNNFGLNYPPLNFHIKC